MSMEQFVTMFTAAVPDATPEEIADTLWLAASAPVGAGGTRPEAGRARQPVLVT